MIVFHDQRMLLENLHANWKATLYLSAQRFAM